MQSMKELDHKIREMARRIKELREIERLSVEEMAKKTVLKQVLKYAPLKSDFVRAVVQDETIKSEISDDMYSVQNENVYEAEFSEVNTETGEVIENEAV